MDDTVVGGGLAGLGTTVALCLGPAGARARRKWAALTPRTKAWARCCFEGVDFASGARAARARALALARSRSPAAARARCQQRQPRVVHTSMTPSSPDLGVLMFSGCIGDIGSIPSGPTYVSFILFGVLLVTWLLLSSIYLGSESGADNSQFALTFFIGFSIFFWLPAGLWIVVTSFDVSSWVCGGLVTIVLFLATPASIVAIHFRARYFRQLRTDEGAHREMGTSLTLGARVAPSRGESDEDEEEEARKRVANEYRSLQEKRRERLGAWVSCALVLGEDVPSE